MLQAFDLSCTCIHALGSVARFSCADSGVRLATGAGGHRHVTTGSLRRVRASLADTSRPRRADPGRLVAGARRPEAILPERGVGEQQELAHDGDQGNLRRLAAAISSRYLRPRSGLCRTAETAAI